MRPALRQKLLNICDVVMPDAAPNVYAACEKLRNVLIRNSPTCQCSQYCVPSAESAHSPGACTNEAFVILRKYGPREPNENLCRECLLCRSDFKAID